MSATIKEKYLKSLRVLKLAATSLIITRTREPYRALDAIQDFVISFNQNIPSMDRNKLISYGTWSILNGWTVLDPDVLENIDIASEVKPDNTTDIGRALSRVLGKDLDKLNIKQMPSGMYAMIWPHFSLENHQIKALLLDIAHHLVFERRHLILIVPEFVNAPPELSDFITYLDYEAPDQDERRQTIDYILEDCDVRLSDKEKDQISYLSSGLTNYELEQSVAKSVQELLDNKEEVTKEKVIEHVLKDKSNMVKKSQILELMKPVPIEELGGLEIIKEWLFDAKKCLTKEAKEFGITPPKGIALGGIPGTGKSLVGKVAGSILDLPPIKFDIGKVFGGIVGSSEERIRQVLALIKIMAPCVVLIDEVDKVFNINRGGGDSGVGDRILGSILTFMQDAEAPVFWILTFNRAQGLPSELLRRGRLDELFGVVEPNQEERMEIIKIHLKNRKQDVSKIIDLHDCVAASEGYVSSEIEGAVNEAVKKAFITSKPVTGKLISEQLKTIKPIMKMYSDQVDDIKNWMEANARPASKGIDFSSIIKDNQKEATRKRSRFSS